MLSWKKIKKIKKVHSIFSKSKLSAQFETCPIIVALIWDSKPFPKKKKICEFIAIIHVKIFFGVAYSNFHPFIVTWWRSRSTIVFENRSISFWVIVENVKFWIFFWKKSFFGGTVLNLIFELQWWDWSQTLQEALT